MKIEPSRIKSALYDSTSFEGDTLLCLIPSV